MVKPVLTVKPVSKNLTYFLRKSLTLIFNSNQCYYTAEYQPFCLRVFRMMDDGALPLVCKLVK